MKLLKLLFLTVLVVALYSCEDNYSEPQDFLQHENQKTTTRSVGSEECGYIGELCKPCPYDLPRADVVFTHGLVINDDGGSGKQFKVQALDIFGENDVYYISDGTEEFIISNTTDEFIKSTADEVKGSEFGQLFKLDHQKLISNSYSNQEIGTDLNANSVVDQGDNRIVTLSTVIGDDDDIVYLWRPCNGWKTSTYLDFTDAFNSPNFVTGTGTLESQVKIAYDKCAENVDLSNSCVDSRCVLESMLNSTNFTWNADQIKKLKTNYLSLLFGLTDTESSEIINAPADFVDELFAISNCGSLAFCPVTSDPNNLLGTLLKNILTSGDLSLEDLNTQLQSEDHIIIRNSSFDNCPRILNVINDIIGDDSTSPMCQIMNTFGNSENANWIVDIGPDTMAVNGNTKILHAFKNAKTLINPDLCDTSCMFIASVLIHEFIHAEMARFVFDKLPDGQEISWALYQNIWNTVADELYGGNDNKHVLMGEHYIDEISIAIWELLGMQGDSLDYAFWGYHGIGMNNLWANGDTILTPMQWDSVQLEYITNIEPNINYDCD